MNKNELKKSIRFGIGYLIVSILIVLYMGFQWQSFVLLGVIILVRILDDVDSFLTIRKEDIKQRNERLADKMKEENFIKELREIQMLVSKGFMKNQELRNELLQYFNSDEDSNFIIDTFRKYMDSEVTKLQEQIDEINKKNHK
jgi:hypothetical protein